jgi:hypothetical protein
MSPDAQQVRHAARELNQWFSSVLRMCDTTLFTIPNSAAHREAAVLAVLTRNAKAVVDRGLDDKGELYTPVCLVLAAACRKLHVEIAETHWKAAIENVAHAWSRPSNLDAALGLAIGTPAAIFKGVFDEALINAGVTDRPTILVAKNRILALGLAINWGMRFLLCYSMEVSRWAASRRKDSRDLGWIRRVIEPLTLRRAERRSASRQ